MDRPNTQTDAIRIREATDGERAFILHPSEEGSEVFVRTGKQVISSCQLGIGIDLWIEELQAMFAEVKRWANERGNRVRSCYGCPTAEHISVYFLPVSRSFDFSLADELAKLNSDLVHRFNVGRVELHQVPWDEADRFFSPGIARLIYGEKLPASEPVEA